MKYIGSAWKESNILQPLNFMFELSPTVEPTALAQARATLPPLRKALAQQRDLLAAGLQMFAALRAEIINKEIKGQGESPLVLGSAARE